MDTLITIGLAGAWAAILLMLFWGVATGWRRVLRDDAALPFFTLLRQRGLSVEKLEQAPDPLFTAVRRCALCAGREQCSASVASGKGAWAACPNQAYLEGLSPRAS
jgi:hypothetical protein